MNGTIYLCRQLLLASCLLFAGPVRVSWGANVAFCPGDAFFSGSLTETTVKRLSEERDDAEFTLKYSYPKGAGDFGGHVGFQRMKIVGLDAATKESIALAKVNGHDH